MCAVVIAAVPIGVHAQQPARTSPNGASRCDGSQLDPDGTTPAHKGLRHLPPFKPTHAHPRLTFNGYDCHRGDRCHLGQGLSQVWQQYRKGRPSVTEPMERTVELAVRPLVDVTARKQALRNLETLQARALLAWMTPVLRANRAGKVPWPATLTKDLLHHWKQHGRWFPMRVWQGVDATRWTDPMGLVARAADLTLAAMEAEAHLNRTSPSCEGRALLRRVVLRWAHGTDASTNMPLGLWSRTNGSEPGNVPLKIHSAVAMAALVLDEPSTPHEPWSQCRDPVSPPMQPWIERARRSLLSERQSPLSGHWAYQTAGGRSLWAEGYYYLHFALRDVIPFAVALRRHRPGSDFFRNPRVLRVLHAMADVTTPEGHVPPVDDGNKRRMYTSGLMRWTGAFGDPALGEKFAWIHDRISRTQSSDPYGQGHAGLDAHLPVVLTMPRLEYCQTRWAPPATVAGEDLPQVVLRREGRRNACAGRGRSAGSCHYVYVNGEPAVGTRRGMGHEQPDQLQLLYYVDHLSMLMDAGYDSAAAFHNSTWNDWRHHNVLAVGPQRSGLPAPRMVKGRAGEAALVRRGEHAGVDNLSHVTRGQTDLIRGRVRLSHGVRYDRHVLVVNHPRGPYMIDVNRGVALRDPQRFSMRYHVNAPKAHLVVAAPHARTRRQPPPWQASEPSLAPLSAQSAPPTAHRLLWKGIHPDYRITGSPGTLADATLRMTFFAVEETGELSLASTRVRESAGPTGPAGDRTVPITTVDLHSSGPRAGFTTVAFLCGARAPHEQRCADLQVSDFPGEVRLRAFAPPAQNPSGQGRPSARVLTVSHAPRGRRPKTVDHIVIRAAQGDPSPLEVVLERDLWILPADHMVGLIRIRDGVVDSNTRIALLPGTAVAPHLARRD